jgi:RNA polymerase sigma-70 factor (ECF subfamily)
MPIRQEFFYVSQSHLCPSRRAQSWALAKYIVTLCLGSGRGHDVVVSEAIYDAIGKLAKQDRHLSHQDERHSEFAELSDENLYQRAFLKPRAIEDVVLDSLLVEQALAIIKTLPLVQAKRFVLRNILGLTYPEISKLEGCSARAVKHSVDLATKQIRKKLNS